MNVQPTVRGPSKLSRSGRLGERLSQPPPTPESPLSGPPIPPSLIPRCTSAGGLSRNGEGSIMRPRNSRTCPRPDFDNLKSKPAISLSSVNARRASPVSRRGVKMPKSPNYPTLGFSCSLLARVAKILLRQGYWSNAVAPPKGCALGRNALQSPD